MPLSPSLVEQFYRDRHGQAVARLLRDRLASFWPALRGLRVLGVGHARPYLGLWRDDATACLDLAFGVPDAGAWAPAGRSLTAVAEGEAFPLDDLSVDRILLVHGLETAPDAQRLLRECWRVLRDDGRLLLLTPNRAGIWARVETTPFGQGEPHSPGQLARLLRSGMFALERRDAALFLPPIDLAALHRFGPVADRLGRRLTPGFGGILLAEAVKDLWAAVPRVATARRVVVRRAGMLVGAVGRRADPPGREAA